MYVIGVSNNEVKGGRRSDKQEGGYKYEKVIVGVGD